MLGHSSYDSSKIMERNFKQGEGIPNTVPTFVHSAKQQQLFQVLRNVYVYALHTVQVSSGIIKLVFSPSVATDGFGSFTSGTR